MVGCQEILTEVLILFGAEVAHGFINFWEFLVDISRISA
jgi:hypothetical protein